MKKSWIAPTEIHVAEILNNRSINQNYIADITESMTDKGFLPEFPIDVFISENLANIDTELPYVCACGAHRTLAATHAKLEKVLVHIHDGREEDFIERMHLDNFQFDPARNAGIGQPFTNKEKRAAVTQLLLLPKFFEQTNTALNTLWNIPEANIRRWRAEVVQLLETHSPKLRHWSVSDGRLARLQELAASTDRKDAEGNVVKIRQPYVDASDDEKKAFWDVIEDDVIESEMDDIRMDDVEKYMARHFDMKDLWRPYKNVTLRQLRQVHQRILDEDADFIQDCLDAARAEKEQEALGDEFKEAVDSCEKAFKKAYAPQESEWSPAFREMQKRFGSFVQSQGEKYVNFQMKYFDYDYDLRTNDERNTELLQTATANHHAVIAAIESEADWLQGFMDAEEETLKEHRHSVEADWRKHRKALIAAVVAYPRPVGESALVYKGDAFLRQDAGTLEKLLSTEEPSAKKFTATIESEANNFKTVAIAIKTDASWVQEIPVPKRLVDVLVTDIAEDHTPLEQVFADIQARFEYLPLDDQELKEAKSEILGILGRLSRGYLPNQIYVLADVGKWLAKIEHESSPFDEG